jgi:hypothetical protein
MVESFRKRFPPPWQVEKDEVGYVVLDAKGEKIIPAFAYSDDLMKARMGADGFYGRRRMLWRKRSARSH